MATIEKRGDAWRVRWRDPDGKERSRRCPTARSAKELKTEVEEAVALGRRWEPAPAVEVPSLVSLIDAWLQDLARLGRAPRTIARAHAVAGPFLAWMRSWLGRDPLVSDLSRQAVEDYDRLHVQAGNEIQTRRVTVWAIAEPWKWGWEHPSWRRWVPPPSLPKMPKIPMARPKAATWEDLDSVVCAATEMAERKSSLEWVRRLVLLERGTGWRVSQCLQVAWPDFDRRRAMLELRPELGKSAQERVGRKIPLPVWLSAMIAKWWEDDGRPENGPIVGVEQSPSLASMMVSKCWKASKADEALYRRRPDHAFRIGLVSQVRAAGVDADAVEIYVGHAIAGVRRHYVDPDKLPLADVARSIPAPRLKLRRVR